MATDQITNQIQHAIFISQPYLKLGEIAITLKHFCFAFQRACPKSDKEENELVMASLRRLYEKKQSNHQHSLTQNSEEVTFTYAHSPAAVIALPLPTPVSFTNHFALSLF